MSVPGKGNSVYRRSHGEMQALKEFLKAGAQGSQGSMCSEAGGVAPSDHVRP